MISFGHPWVLALLVLVPVLWGLWLFGASRGARRVRAISRTPVTGPPIVASFLLALAAGTAIIAAAQPRWGEEDAFIPRRGADLLVVLDVSRSMGAQDVAPNRLDAAKATIGDTFARLGGDRAGLVIFGGDAMVRMPLTADLQAATRIVETLEPGPIFVGGGSASSSGLDLAIGTFDPESEAGRLIVLITDGDDLGADPAAMATRIRDSGIEFIVVGVGTVDGIAVPVVDPETGASSDLLDASGQPVITRLNDPFLRALAAAAEGQYLGSDLGVLPGVVASRMSSLNTAQFDERSATIDIERAPWFAAAALVLALLAAFAERFRPRRRAGVLALTAVAMLVAASCATDAYEANEAGVKAFAAGDYAAAEERFIEAQAEQPDDPEVALNLAAALSAQGRHDEAVNAARRALSSTSTRWRAAAHSSLGHHWFAIGDLPLALEEFKQALLEDPENQSFRHDYEVVLRILTPPPPGEEAPGPPGSSPTGPPGEGSATPGPSASQTPEGQGPPGEGGEGGDGSEPNDDPGKPGPGGQDAGDGLSDEELEEIVKQMDAEIARLIEEAGEEPTPAQALEILRRIAERSRIAAQQAGRGDSPDPSDY